VGGNIKRISEFEFNAKCLGASSFPYKYSGDGLK